MLPASQAKVSSENLITAVSLPNNAVTTESGSVERSSVASEDVSASDPSSVQFAPYVNVVVPRVSVPLTMFQLASNVHS